MRAVAARCVIWMCERIAFAAPDGVVSGDALDDRPVLVRAPPWCAPDG